MRRGPWVESVVDVVRATGATAIHVSDDVSAYARTRLARLDAAAGDNANVVRAPGVTVVSPGALTPADSGDHYKVFTPYYRRWSEARRRAVEPTPTKLAVPAAVDSGKLPALADLVVGDRAPT